MKNFTLVFVLFFTAVLSFAQSDQSRQVKIDSLEMVRNDLANRLKMVEAELADLKTVKVETPVSTSPSEYIIIKIKNPFDLKDKFDHKVMLLVGDSIELLSLENNNFQVRYNGKEYSAWKFSVYNNWYAMTGKPVSKLEEEWERWYGPHRAQIEEQQRIKAEQKLNLAVQQAEARKQSLFNRFGKIDAERILNKQIWIGMTSSMAIESRGYPDEKNRTETASGTREQWVYGKLVSYCYYLYFDDGILTAIQN